jgi:predicted transcriptional regulator
MIFYGHLLEILDDLGNKKIQVLKHIIEKRERTNNIFLGTIKEMADALNISYATIHNTLILLEDKEVIRRRNSIIYINADLICDGRFKGKIMHIYEDAEKKETEEEQENRLKREIERHRNEAEQLEFFLKKKKGK